jgi:hypothetical protein
MRARLVVPTTGWTWADALFIRHLFYKASYFSYKAVRVADRLSAHRAQDQGRPGLDGDVVLAACEIRTPPCHFRNIIPYSCGKQGWSDRL